MRHPQVIKSHWRKLVDSWRDATAERMVPEYSDSHDRSRNHQYYR